MTSMRFLKAIAVSFACSGFLIPQQLLADGPKPLAIKRNFIKVPAAVDLAMSAGGTIAGRVIGANRKAISDTGVIIRRGKTDIATTVTDERGRFQVKNLRAGLYSVVVGGSQGLVRCWAPGTAPPSAHERMVVVIGDTVIRAQSPDGPQDILYDENGVPYGRVRIANQPPISQPPINGQVAGPVVVTDAAATGGGFFGGADLLTVLLAAGIGTGVYYGIVNNDNIDDLQDTVNSIPQSP